MIWHSSELSAVKRELGVDEQNGLTAAEVVSRIQRFGENRTEKAKEKTVPEKIIKRISNVMVVIMLVVSAILLVTDIISKSGDWYVPILILVVLGLHFTSDIFAERFSLKEIASLKGKDSPSARVRRDGEESVIDAAMLVPGDVVLLEQGDYIPADGRLIESHSLVCDESALSGDAAPSEKQAEYMPEDITPIEQRKNMVHAGCSVTYGYGVMIVTDTAMETELARKQAIIEQTQGNDLPIHKQVKSVSKLVNYILICVAAVIFFAGLISGTAENESFSHLVLSMILTFCAVSLSVLPETLPKSITAAYGFGVRRYLKRKIAVKNLQAIEKLGDVSVIISDKTGTLTKNRMQMTEIYDGNASFDVGIDELNENVLTLIKMGALCTNTTVAIGSGKNIRFTGDPTEAGIVSACINYCGMSKEDIENIYPRMAEVPFDSERKLMTTVNMINNRPFAIVKGAPDILMEYCVGGNLKGAAEAAEQMEKKGFRVIAVAVKPLDEVPSNPTADNMESSLNLLGLFGLSDTVSLGTRNALKNADNLGIRTVMITGDHITTAIAFAKNLGILREGEKAVTGEELSVMSDEALAEEIKNISVYSRISPKDKLRIVSAWQAKGEVVALTGDSVTDAAALKTADVGCAMGVTGTDIAKSSSDVLLTEDSYISIVGAVQESKAIYHNIKHTTSFLLSGNLAVLTVMLFGFIIFGVSPFTALALLFLNLIASVAPVISLVAEPAEENPEKSVNTKSEKLFTSLYLTNTAIQGVIVGVIGLIAFAIGNKISAGAGSGLAFAVMMLAQSTLAFALRSDKLVYKKGIFKNKYSFIALGVSIFLTILLVATPVRAAFGLVALGGLGWHILWLALLPFVVVEVIKLIKFLLK